MVIRQTRSGWLRGKGFGSFGPVHRNTDLPWDFSGCSPQGIPFLLMARNRQQLKSLGIPVAASWSYRSWWEASGDRQHQAGEELNLSISRDRCSKYSGPWVPGASSQDPNHQWAIMSLPSWRRPSLSLWFPAWPAQALMLLEALNSLPHWEAELRRHGDAEIPPLFPASPFPLPFQLPLLWALQSAVWWSESSDKHWVKQLKINPLVVKREDFADT